MNAVEVTEPKIASTVVEKIVGTKKPIRIALTGKMRSGKDTLGEMLMELDNFQHVKFSKGISEIVHGYIKGADEAKLREAYQKIGQTMRSIYENVWVDYAFKDVDMDKNIIVTDLRQPNELKFLQENGFTIIKIKSDESDRIERMNALGDNYTQESLSHETELVIDDIVEDITVWNDSTLADLKIKAEFLKRCLEL